MDEQDPAGAEAEALENMIYEDPDASDIYREQMDHWWSRTSCNGTSGVFAAEEEFCIVASNCLTAWMLEETADKLLGWINSRKPFYAYASDCGVSYNP